MGIISKKRKFNMFDKRIKSKVRNELISEIEDFVYSNKNTLAKKIA